MSRPGRKPQGTKHLEKFAASARARLRMRMILETLAGGRTIPEACRMLGIGEAMFHRIRDEALAASLAALDVERGFVGSHYGGWSRVVREGLVAGWRASEQGKDRRRAQACRYRERLRERRPDPDPLQAEGQAEPGQDPKSGS